MAKQTQTPEDQCPDLAAYAQTMMHCDMPVQELGPRAAFNTLRWAAQWFAWSDEATRVRNAAAIRTIAEFVASKVEAEAPPPAAGPPGEPAATPYYLKGD